MNISFVIPVLNGEKYIGQCIDSIMREAEELDHIIVVDNGSTDETVNIVNAYGNVRLLILPGLTVSALRNRGVNETDNQLVAFIDADCILAEGWRKNVLDVLLDESIHATGSLVDIPDKATWIERVWFSQKPDERRFASYINSGNLIVRKEIFNYVGGFDERLKSDEDCEFGERLNMLGYKMFEDPAIQVIHMDNPTSLKDFYIREKWHATSVLATQSLITLDRPTIMSILFGISLIFSLIFFVAGLSIKTEMLWFSLSVLFIPLITSIYRAHKFKIYRYMPGLMLLWSLFYLARLSNMGDYLLLKKTSNS